MSCSSDFGIVFRESPDAIMIIDAEDGSILNINRSFSTILEYREEALRGKHFSILFPREEEERKLSVQVYGAVLENQMVLKAGGDLCLMDLTATIVPWGEKKIIIATFRDITERKQLEEALRESESKYRRLIELAREGIMVIDTHGRIGFVNPRMAGMIGYTADEMIGKKFFRLMDEKSASLCEYNVEKWKGLLREGRDFEFIHKEGMSIYTGISTSDITDLEGNYIGTLAVVSDITEERKIEKQKEKYRLNLEAIFRSVQDGIVTVDKNLVVTEINRTAGKICGFNRNSIGKPLNALGCEGKCLAGVLETLKTEEPVKLYRIKCEPPDMPARLISLTTSPLLDKDCVAGGAVMVITDETRLATLEKELKDRQQYHKIIGKSEAMQKLYSMIETLADVQSTVLITGESGTGKELVAAALHYMGERSSKPLVKVNCSALPETLLESELFGHVKGAFTGAIKDKIGLFQRADGGTIFLDEIGDISFATQLRLLRILQESEFERVGDTKPFKLDIRVIAATNQNLPEKVRKGEFREDLYYRLKVVELYIPPLRERMEDIPLLTESFLNKFNEKFKKEIPGISEEVERIFMSHNWPGNIRELEHAMEHASILNHGSFISIEDLPGDLREITAPAQPSPEDSKDGREILMDALEKCAWNKAKAARLLGMSRQTIYRKIKEYGLSQ